MSRDDGALQRFFRRQERQKQQRQQMPGEDEPPLPEPVKPIHGQPQPGRNDPCPCGSGKKYKKCCGRKG